MRAPVLILLVLATPLLAAACSERVLTPVPLSDGYGPVGGGEPSSGSGSGGTSSAPPTPTTPPSQPPPSDEAGSGGSSGSSGSSSGGGSTEDDAGPPDTGSAGFDAGAPADGGDVAALLPVCVGQINGFRNQNGQSPLTEASDLESYAAKAAASDAHNGQLHSYFYATGGGGVAATEDELDGAKVDPGASAQQTMEQGLLNDEQASGAAAANLLDPQFSEVGCGFGQDPAGNWWVVIGLR